jgi:hypothetical protein
MSNDHMSGLAQEFVQHCKAGGIALDYKPRTLPLVDKVIGAARSHAPGSEEHTKHANWITAYVGEVIRQETGGRWYEQNGTWVVDVGDHQTSPGEAVTALIEGGHASEGDVTLATTKAYCELVFKRQRIWLEGTLLGPYESMAALRTSMTADAKLAGWLVAQAQTAVQTGKVTWKESLDFSSDSLDGVERIMSALHNRLKFPKPGEQLTDEELTTAVRVWGIYVGEVIRRHYGGQWVTGADGLVELAIGGKSAQPLAKVRKRITDGSGDNLRYYFSSITKLIGSS